MKFIMFNFFKTEIGIIILLGINFILFTIVIINNLKINKMNKNSKEFMKKVGNGKDIKEDLEKYMNRVEELERALSETNSYCKQINQKIKGCIQKVGIVKYNAYNDTINELSFAVALLDEKNNGIVLNGIYSRDMSNIYAKPVENGKSNFVLIEEEKQAIERAMNKE